jgi:hypothetical protein
MLSCVVGSSRVVGGGDHVPKAIALIAASCLGPETLTAVRKAFDNAWAEVAGKFYDVAQKETARLTLATAILSVATNENRDVETLKQAGLQALAPNQS